MTTSDSSPPLRRRRQRCCEKLIYVARHAQALHNVKEQEAVSQAKRWTQSQQLLEQARKSVLDDPSLRDAPLSPPGHHQIQRQQSLLTLLNEQDGQSYPRPEIVLVSPLRRALETATELFHLVPQQQQPSDDGSTTTTTTTTTSSSSPPPRFVALEVLREKRTGFVADERSSVTDLQGQFPHVDFSDLVTLQSTHATAVRPGEDNASVQQRARYVLDHTLPALTETTVALVTHKGWLREMRHVLTARAQAGELEIHYCDNHDNKNDNNNNTGDSTNDKSFDWDRTLYKNAEVRIAKCAWEKPADDKDRDNQQCCRGPFTSLWSKSVETALQETMGKNDCRDSSPSNNLLPRDSIETRQ
mmetsp:Transcript_30169/g.70470  ORF Transcript_30169/g.70470 Transcript_30169/m.70470 type:complete len:358 (+) Transcript_30169:253-1326(+)